MPHSKCSQYDNKQWSCRVCPGVMSSRWVRWSGCLSVVRWAACLDLACPSTPCRVPLTAGLSLASAESWSNNTHAHSYIHIYTIILLKSVAVRKLQVAILARSSREMSPTVRIDWQYNLSWVHISVHPSKFFIREKHDELSGRPSLAQVSVECAGHDRSPVTTWVHERRQQPS